MNLYENKNRWIHRLDPRSKLAFSFVYTVLLFLANHPLYLFALTLMIFFIGWSGAALGRLKKITPVLVFIGLMTIFLWTLFIDGKTHLIGWIDVESVLFGMTAALRIINVILLTMVFFATTRVEELTTGMVKLGFPYPISFVFSMAMRWVPTLLAAMYLIIQAQRSRGLDLESGSIIEKMKRSVPLVVPVILMSLRNINQLAMALESKGFGASRQRTSYLQLRLTRSDKAVLLVTLFMAVGGSIVCGFHLFQISGLVR